MRDGMIPDDEAVSDIFATHYGLASVLSNPSRVCWFCLRMNLSYEAVWEKIFQFSSSFFCLFLVLSLAVFAIADFGA